MTDWTYPADVMRAQMLGIQVRCRNCRSTGGGSHACRRHRTNAEKDAAGFHRVKNTNKINEWSADSVPLCRDFRLPIKPREEDPTSNE